MTKHRLTSAEQLMNDSHRTIAQLKQMVPALVRERNHAQAESEHWKSQAMLISHDAMAVANENIALKLRIAFLEAQHPAPMIEIRQSDEVSVVSLPSLSHDQQVELYEAGKGVAFPFTPLEHPDAIGNSDDALHLSSSHQ